MLPTPTPPMLAQQRSTNRLPMNDTLRTKLMRSDLKQEHALRPDVVSQWTRILRGRIVVMAGDSTSIKLCGALITTVKPEPCPIIWKGNMQENEVPKDWSVDAHGTAAPGSFSYSPFLAPRRGRGALCCLRTGLLFLRDTRANENTRVPRPITIESCALSANITKANHPNVSQTMRDQPWVHHNLGDTLQCMLATNVLRASDVVIANSGLHHNSLSTLKPNLDSFLDFYHAARSAKMHVLWRETTPQHWPTPSGEYAICDFGSTTRPDVVDDKCRGPGVCTSRQYPCAPLADSALKAGHRQKWNDFTEPFLQASRVPTIRLFDLYAGWHYLHEGSFFRDEDTKRVFAVDCTHFVGQFVDMRAALLIATDVSRALLVPISAPAVKSPDIGKAAKLLLKPASAKTTNPAGTHRVPSVEEQMLLKERKKLAG